MIGLTLVAGCATTAPPEGSTAHRPATENSLEAPEQRGDSATPETTVEEKPRASAPRGSQSGGELPEVTLPKPEDPETHYQRRRDRYTARLLEDMTIEEKVGQLIFPSLGDVAGPGVRQRGEALSRFLSTVRPGGFILFTDNIHTPDQVRRLINELQADREIPLFVAVDEEGGVVSRIT
ncbi:MAG: hypothetical protein GVY29_04850, partial [Spirochaetes bacterium]|nr:hypothetical protein [Spirochaetota bacterium]